MREDGGSRPAVVVVTWQGAHLLRPCLDSLRAQTLAHDVIVVDNASTDGTTELLAAEYPEARVVRNDRNLGFAGGLQIGLDAADRALVAVLNNDAVAEPEWLEQLADELGRHPEAAAITSRILLAGTEPARLNNAGVVLLPDGYGADRGLGEAADAFPDAGPVWGFSGGAALLRAAAVRAVGGVPAPFFLYYEDTDISWRLRMAGWEIRYQPRAVVRHRHAASSDVTSEAFAFWNERNRLLMHARCAGPAAATRIWARFLLTTASLAVRRARGGDVPPAHHFRPVVRLRILASALRLLPWALNSRRAIRSAPAAPQLSPGQP